MTAFVALIPVAQAFCSVDSSAGSPATTSIGADEHARAPVGDEAPDPCCDQPPFVLATPTDKADDLAAASARAVGAPLVAVAAVLSPAFRAIARPALRIGSPPPPELLFRRLKRLLI